MNSKRNLALLIVLVLFLLGGWFILKSNKSLSPSVAPAPTTPTPSSEPSKESSTGASISQTVVKITKIGFDPEMVTIKAGGSVTWQNVDALAHDVSSAPHPTHTSYPPLNLGSIGPSMSKSLTFETAGTYKYHDNLYPSFRGTVVVK